MNTPLRLPPSPSRSALRFLLVAALLWGVLPPLPALAQQATREQLLSAYLYNFAKNIRWQNEESFSAFRVHVVSDNPLLARELTRLAQNRSLRSKPIRVSSSTSVQDIEKAHLVFASKEKEPLLAAIVDRIEGRNILLVTEEFRDTRLVMINLIESKSGSLRFEINKANLVNQGFQVTEDLILLGGTEVDVATLYREGQQSLRALQKKIDLLESNLSALEKDIARRTSELRVQQDSLVSLSSRIRDQESALSRQTEYLNEREAALSAMTRRLRDVTATFTHKSQELEQQNANLRAGRASLDTLKTEIRSREEVLRRQSRELEERGSTITRQQTYLTLLGIIALLTIALAGLTYASYSGKKKLSRQLEVKVRERTDDLQEANARLMIELDERLLTEEALKESEYLYRFLFEHSPLPMLVYDLESLRLVAVNTAFIHQYGFTSEEALALRLPDLYPEEEKGPIRTMASSLKGHAYAGEWHHRKKNGSLIDIEAYSCDIMYEGRDARIAVVTDITERKRVEAELREHRVHLEDRVRERTAELITANERLGAIFDATNVGIVLQQRRTILQCNRRLEEIFGYEPEELRGKPTRLWYRNEEDYAGGGPPMMETLAKGETHQREQVLVRKDGMLFTARISVRALDPTDLDKGLVVVIEDVTKEREAEESLRRALEAAKAADRLKSSFLATMSHELRTPLNSIIGFTGILLKELAGPLNTEQKKQLGMARGSAQHLLDLINDVLDISKIEAGQLVLSIQEMNLTQVLQRTIDSVRPLADKKHLTLSASLPEEEILIVSDERKVGQIFLNLLNNAIKFTERGSVSLELLRQEYSVLVHVRDTGIGITEEDRDKLFKPFSQIDTGLTRNHEGTGLGLSISKRLVDKLGGTITVESAEGRGSTFSVMLPFQSPPHQSGEEHGTTHSDH